jgi:hypothetical protein
VQRLASSPEVAALFSHCGCLACPSQVGLVWVRPSTAVVPNKDHTLRPAYLAEVARARLGTDPVELDTGHCPRGYIRTRSQIFFSPSFALHSRPLSGTLR